MAILKLDFLVLPTYNKYTLGVADTSTYVVTPVSPTIKINVPGFGDVSIPFVPNDFNVFNSTTLGITSVNDDLIPLPDGVYTLTYSILPAETNYITKTIIRVEQLQEKFDLAFMKLDLMECDKAIKTQSKVTLNTIYYLIQGSISSANNCAIDISNKLYTKASKMLDSFNKNYCDCSGTNYIINF